MNAKLQSALVAILEKAAQGVDFAVDQAPDVVQQLLVWQFWISLANFSVGILMIIAAAILMKWTAKKWAGWRKDDMEPMGVINGFVSLALVVAGLINCAQNQNWVEVWLAPKVFILEYAASLVR